MKQTSTRYHNVDSQYNKGVNMQSRLDGVNDEVMAYNDGYVVQVITSSTTTVIKTGRTQVSKIRVVGGTMGNVTIYDNTSAAGTQVYPTKTPASGDVLLEPCTLMNGLTIVTAAATNIQVYFK